MTTRLIRASTVTAVVAATAGTLAVGPALAAPAIGCPTSYQLLSVSDLSTLGYAVPAQMDDPTSGFRSFGHAGNGNGWVCALPLGNQTTSFGAQLYNFMDDTLRS